MNSKTISIISLSVAVVVAAIAAIMVTNKRAETARHQAAAAESRADETRAAQRQAEAEAAKARSEESAAAKAAAAATEERAAKEAASAAAQAEAAKAVADRAKAEAARAEAEAQAKKASDARAAEEARVRISRNEAEKVRAEAEVEASKAAAAADALALEKQRSDAIIAEAKLWEAREKDLASLEQELMQFKRELDERELALRPEKTIKDLVNIGGDAAATNNASEVNLPENDTSLPRAARQLARTERLLKESTTAQLDAMKSNSIARLEKLYVEAVRSDRVTTAAYYRKTLKSLYPDWEYRPSEAEKTEEKEEKK